MVTRPDKDAFLVTTSQEGGNMMSDLSYAMTAPGSQPTIPLPPVPLVLRPDGTPVTGLDDTAGARAHGQTNWTQGGACIPGPHWSNAEQIPVSNMAKSGRVPTPPGGSAIPGSAGGTGTAPEWVDTIKGPTPPSGEDTSPRNPPDTSTWKEI